MQVPRGMYRLRYFQGSGMAGPDSTKRRMVLRLVVFGVAALVALVSWLTTRDHAEPAAKGETTQTRIVSAAELSSIAALVGHPVYWAGPITGAELEATEGPEGDVQVRYLEAGAEAGEGEGEALTVGSYPLPDPSGALAAFAERPGSATRRAPGGREVVVSRRKPTSAYFVSPGNEVQVEVYDPSPKRALALALSPKVRPAP
jgi:hypothetical protein